MSAEQPVAPQHTFDHNARALMLNVERLARELIDIKKEMKQQRHGGYCYDFVPPVTGGNAMKKIVAPMICFFLSLSLLASEGTLMTDRPALTKKRFVHVDSEDEYEVDGRGRWLRFTTTYEGVKYSIFADGDQVCVNGLPKLQIRRNGFRNVSTVSVDDRDVLNYEYNDDGSVRRVVLDSAYSLSIATESKTRITRYSLANEDGHVLKEAQSEDVIAKRPFTTDFQLGFVAEQLKIDETWMNRVRASASSNKHIFKIRDEKSKVIAVAVRFGSVLAVFQPDGRALFVKVDLAGDMPPQVTGRVPTEVSVAADGRVGMHVIFPLKNGFESAWTVRNGDRRGLRYSFASRLQRRSKVSAQMRYECDTSEVCYTYYGQEYCTVTHYWCETDDGGGGSGGGDYDPGSGSGGGSAAGSTGIANPALKQSVDDAKDDAMAKLIGNQQCVTVFKQFSDSSGTPLDQAIANKFNNTTPYDFVSKYLIFRDGTNSGNCGGSTLAYTSPGSTLIWFCYPGFSDIQRSQPGVAANRIIHEALHSAGLQEDPPVAGAPNDGQIDGAIAQACGN